MLNKKKPDRRRHAVFERDVDGGAGVFLRGGSTLHSMLFYFLRRSLLDRRFRHHHLRCQEKT